MKKILSIMMAFLLVFTITACSNENDAVEEVSNAYFTALEKGDVNQAKKYCTNDAASKAGMNLISSDLEDELNELNFGDEFDSAANKFVKKLVKSVFKSYETQSISVDEDVATVKVNVKGINTKDMDTDHWVKEMNTLISDYVSENNDRISEMEEEDEDKAEETIVSELSDIILDTFNEEVDNTKTHTYTMTLTLKKNKDTWQITKIKNFGGSKATSTPKNA